MARSVFLLGLGIAAVGVAFGLLDLVIGPTPGVTEANVRRLRAGMSIEDVEAILGDSSPWLTYGGRVDRVKLKELCDPPPCVDVPRDRVAATKEGDEGSAVVFLSTAGRVRWAEWHPYAAGPGYVPFRIRGATCPTFLSRLRSWAGW
jgi:hypothetical protein